LFQIEPIGADSTIRFDRALQMLSDSMFDLFCRVTEDSDGFRLHISDMNKNGTGVYFCVLLGRDGDVYRNTWIVKQSEPVKSVDLYPSAPMGREGDLLSLR